MNTRTRTGLRSVLAISVCIFSISGAALAQTSGSLTLIPNPTPDLGDMFGFRVALVGDDAVLIGAPGDDTAETNGGIAYLYSLNGTLLQTFFSPVPRVNESFGILVEAVGDDRVLITALQVDDKMKPDLPGAAYLFDLDGTHVETFLNPSPSIGDAFGVAAALPDGTLMIGSFGDDADSENAGRAYQYQPGGNGEPLQTFSDPTPEVDGLFGFPVNALGADRFIVGARDANDEAGEVHVFNHLTGAHVTTIAHPDQTFSLVNSTAALGSDIVVVGSEDWTVDGELWAGGVFLFDAANGNLLLTIPNPAPEQDDAFGIFVETIASDTIIIGADLDNPGDIDSAGTVYVYDAAGNLLDTINNPTPEANDQFGFALSANLAGVLAIGSPQGEFDFFAAAGQVYIATGLSDAAPAVLTTCNITFGSTDNDPCDVANLGSDDDVDQILRSQFGFSAFERNLTEIVIHGNGAGAATMVSINTRDGSDTTNVVGKVKARNYTSNSIVDLAQYDVSFPLPDTPHTTIVNSADFVDANGDIELRLRYVAPATFTPLGFTVGLDQVRVMVE